MWRSTRTWSSNRNLGLVLASHRAARAPLNRSGRRGYRSRVLGLVFTAARAAATSFFPPAHRCSDAIHLHRPWRQVLGGKTPDEMRKRKMMRRRKVVLKELEFFPKTTGFIYKQTLMGLCKLKVQVHLWAFLAPSRR
jgi:hypothetical protein